MIVAYTELKDILNKVFEGMGFPLGDYEDCANDIAWMELHGWPVLDDILNSQPMPQSSAANFIYEDDTLSVFDAQNNGGLIYGSLALDLAGLKARQQPLAIVKLINAHHPQLIIPSLTNRAEQEMNVLLSWQEKNTNYLVFMGSEEKFPTVTIFSNNSPSLDANLTILSGTAVMPPLSIHSRPTRMITPTDFQENFDHRIEYGIQVSDRQWQELVRLSKKILVESTDDSRKRGAGEDAC